METALVSLLGRGAMTNHEVVRLIIVSASRVMEYHCRLCCRSTHTWNHGSRSYRFLNT